MLVQSKGNPVGALLFQLRSYFCDEYLGLYKDNNSHKLKSIILDHIWPELNQKQRLSKALLLDSWPVRLTLSLDTWICGSIFNYCEQK